MDQRDLSIIAQNAGTTAAVIYNATIGSTGDWLPEAFDEIRDHLFNGVLRLVAEGQVQQTFPGAQVIDTVAQPVPQQAPPVPQQQYAQPAQTAYAPPPVPQAAPPPPPAQAGGVPNCDKCGGPMWDNRVGKRNPKAPDFKCKNKENCDGAKWLTPYSR